MVEIAVTEEIGKRKRNDQRFAGRDSKEKEEEDEARNLIEEMQRNLDEVQNKSCEVEQKLNRILGIHRCFWHGTRTSEAHGDKTLAADAEK